MDMQEVRMNEVYKTRLSKDDFKRLSTFIYDELGIKMPEVKKVMLQSRLQRRLIALNMHSFSEYLDFAFSKEGKHTELIQMIDLVTTNKTDFFREASHFDFLTSQILPQITANSAIRRQYKFWSAGCSSGEEPYTLAMVLLEYAEKNPMFDFSILGTDLSTRVLKKAVSAIYALERVHDIPMSLKKKYMLKSKNTEKPMVKMGPELCSKVSFQHLNFMDEYYNINETFDIAFCRNVLIYFDRITQEKVINRICTKIKPGGYLFLGHSESINNLNVPLIQIKPTIFMLKS